MYNVFQEIGRQQELYTKHLDAFKKLTARLRAECGDTFVINRDEVDPRVLVFRFVDWEYQIRHEFNGQVAGGGMSLIRSRRRRWPDDDFDDLGTLHMDSRGNVGLEESRGWSIENDLDEITEVLILPRG